MGPIGVDWKESALLNGPMLPVFVAADESSAGAGACAGIWAALIIGERQFQAGVSGENARIR
jgi:hypothetical protein